MPLLHAAVTPAFGHATLDHKLHIIAEPNRTTATQLKSAIVKGHDIPLYNL